MYRKYIQLVACLVVIGLAFPLQAWKIDGSSFVAEQGDTFWSLASQYNFSTLEIYKKCKVSRSAQKHNIDIGQRFYCPEILGIDTKTVTETIEKVEIIEKPIKIELLEEVRDRQNESSKYLEKIYKNVQKRDNETRPIKIDDDLKSILGKEISSSNLKISKKLESDLESVNNNLNESFKSVNDAIDKASGFHFLTELKSSIFSIPFSVFSNAITPAVIGLLIYLFKDFFLTLVGGKAKKREEVDKHEQPLTTNVISRLINIVIIVLIAISIWLLLSLLSENKDAGQQKQSGSQLTEYVANTKNTSPTGKDNDHERGEGAMTIQMIWNYISVIAIAVCMFFLLKRMNTIKELNQNNKWLKKKYTTDKVTIIEKALTDQLNKKKINMGEYLEIISAFKSLMFLGHEDEYKNVFTDEVVSTDQSLKILNEHKNIIPPESIIHLLENEDINQSVKKYIFSNYLID